MGVTPLMREAVSAMTFAALHGARNCYRFFQAKRGCKTGAVSQHGKEGGETGERDGATPVRESVITLAGFRS